MCPWQLSKRLGIVSRHGLEFAKLSSLQTKAKTYAPLTIWREFCRYSGCSLRGSYLLWFVTKMISVFNVHYKKEFF